MIGREVLHFALYGAAKRLTVLVEFPVAVLWSVVPPMLVDLSARGQRERLQRLSLAATTTASLPAVAAFLLFKFFASEILALTYGAIFAESATILNFLIADMLVFLTMGPASLTLVMTGHARVVLRITVISATLSLLALYFRGLFGGLTGVAIAYTGLSIATSFWYLLEARRQTGTRVYASPFETPPMVKVVRHMIGTRPCPIGGVSIQPRLGRSSGLPPRRVPKDLSILFHRCPADLLDDLLVSEARA